MKHSSGQIAEWGVMCIGKNRYNCVCQNNCVVSIKFHKCYAKVREASYV